MARGIKTGINPSQQYAVIPDINDKILADLIVMAWLH
jgi:hypothetical protein